MSQSPNKMKHTPGPWTRKFGSSVYAGPGPFETQQLLFVAQPTNGTKEELDEVFANARLIAAAPELLEALKACLVDMADYESPKRGYFVTAQNARAIIAKIEGGTSA